MDLYQSFENTIEAEKNAGLGLIVLGLVYLTISIYLFTFADKNISIIGAKFLSLIMGLFIVIGGPIRLMPFASRNGLPTLILFNICD